MQKGGLRMRGDGREVRKRVEGLRKKERNCKERWKGKGRPGRRDWWSQITGQEGEVCDNNRNQVE